MRGELAPNSRLVEADLSQAFSMSRGAVRTALVRLEQEGLVTREPNRGARVRHIGDEEAVEILQARAALEGLAAAEAARRIDAKGAKRLEKALDRHTKAGGGGRPAGGLRRQRRAARGPARAFGNSTVQQLIRRLKSQTVRFQFRTILVPGRPAVSHKEHAAIVNAVLEGKPSRPRRPCGITCSAWPTRCGRPRGRGDDRTSRPQRRGPRARPRRLRRARAHRSRRRRPPDRRPVARPTLPRGGAGRVRAQVSLHVDRRARFGGAAPPCPAPTCAARWR